MNKYEASQFPFLVFMKTVTAGHNLPPVANDETGGEGLLNLWEC